MDNTCFLCSNTIKNELINLRTKKTNHTKINLLTFLQNIAPNALTEHCDKNICHLCFTLINDLDLARKKCQDLTKLLLSYLEKRNVQSVKTESKENFIQPELLCDSVIIKEEIDIDENDVCFEEDVPEKIELINCDSLGVVDQNDSESNSQTMISNKCNFCNEDFNSLNALAIHIKKQHGDDKLLDKEQSSSEDNNIAEPLEAENKTKPKRTRKKKKVEKKENVNCLKPHVCEQCNKAFKTPFELKSHILTHSDLKPYVCDICGHSYKHKASLDIHVGMHNGINPFTCVYCNKSYTQKGSLERHMPIHTGDCPYQCDLCGKRFIHRSSFKIHQASHTGKKDYKCEVCGIALVSVSHLTRHMRVHTGEKKYECPTCTKKFAEKYNLMSHLKLHEEGPSANKHKCEICNLTFQRPNKLKKHMIAKHQNVDFSKSDECDNLPPAEQNETNGNSMSS